jgi:hypothetical protein
MPASAKIQMDLQQALARNLSHDVVSNKLI